ncbi:MAG TPA: FkbM family methyltransferase [Solirubrobacteraceae bacterium]|nr:FkbM family methyltransferase [Solirubrobacteraceae bacterium]
MAAQQYTTDIPRGCLTAPARVARTRLVWLLMRVVPHERMARWSARGLLRPLQPLTGRGELTILGGLAARLRIEARTFAPWGAQAYAVLTGTHEIQVQQALVRSLRAGDHVWDVGSNIGYLALVAARIVGPGGRVVAIEPDAGCAAAIRMNAALNGLATIEVLEAAATDRSGVADLVVVRDRLWTRLASVGDHHEGERRVEVRAVALDDVEGPPPTIVKIDVEGAELDVLAGMRRLLRDARPLVICEMHGRNAEFCAAMDAAGYSVCNLDGPEPVHEAGVNVHALCTPRPLAAA